MTTKQRQHLLAYLGYYVGNVDGEWGTLSKTACTAFQKDFGGIKVDGFGGTETDKALCHSVSYGMPAKKVDKSEKEDITGTSGTKSNISPVTSSNANVVESIAKDIHMNPMNAW